MLTVSTFASGITFNLILKPSGNPPALVQLYLSYANSLFCGAIMGCVLIKVSIELCKSSVDYVTKWREKVEKVKPQDSKWKQGVVSRIGDREKWRVSNGRSGPSRNRKMKIWKKSDRAEFWRMQVEEFRMTYEGGPREMLLQWLYIEEYAPRMMKNIGHWILGVEIAIVAVILFVALYFLLLACKYFLQIEGPFLAGTIIYWFFLRRYGIYDLPSFGRRKLDALEGEHNAARRYHRKFLDYSSRHGRS